MSPSAKLRSEQLKEIIQDQKKTDKGGREVQEQVENSEEVLDPENTSLVLNTVLNTFNNEYDYECHAEAVRLLYAFLISQLTGDWVPGNKYSIPGLPRTKFLANQVWAIWFIVRKCVWDSDMPGGLVADEMGLAKTFTSVAAAMLCKLLTEKVVMWLPLSILWGNTPEEWVNMVQNNYPRIINEEWESFLLHR